MSRRAGVLLHPTSLPGGAAELASAADRFLEWGERAGMSTWQVLPLGPAGAGGSPYGALSAFAGEPRWFALERDADARLDAFVEGHRDWLPDWCLFAAIKAAHGGRSWLDWDEPLRRREPGALARAERELAPAIARHQRAQLAFLDGWSAIRAAAQRRRIAILGDVPIYPAIDSADVWAHPDLFWLDEDLRPAKLAGVPPDYFSETGQLWGNPLYRWDRHAESGFSWWISRIRHQLTLHDALRLDHFRGFAGYWAVPAGAANAIEGAWEPGPGRALFDALAAALGPTPFVAEDLGVITEDVVALRAAFGLPGMRVLQFGFGDPASDHAPHNLSRDVVVYTGTHDNDTSRGWFAALDPAGRRRVLDYLGGTAEEVAWSMVRAAMTSVADLAVVPMQDVLDLGSEGRMNVPGIAEGNWTWRAAPGALDADRAGRLRSLVELSGRGGS